MKIYNEIVIDMNPESSTFEETLYEDSFEYNGDMMLMQETIGLVTDPSQMNFKERMELYHQHGGSIVVNGRYYEWPLTNLSTPTYWKEVKNPADPDKYVQVGSSVGQVGESTQWGAPNITKDMFIKDDGQPRTVKEIYAKLDPVLTGITGAKLVNYINDLLPKFTKAATEERTFLSREKGLREEAATQKKESDIYELQKRAAEAGKTPITGAGMRTSIGSKTDIRKGFGAAQDAYSLSIEKAKLSEEKGLYGLTQDTTGAFEAAVGTAIAGMETPFGKPGSVPKVNPDFFAREGGRIPTKNVSFLDFLTSLPEAGGS